MTFRDFTWSIFIYGSSPLGVARQDVEGRLKEALDEVGEVSGGGGGESGWNIDVEVFDGKNSSLPFRLFRKFS